VLQRVTVVASRPDDTLIYLQADYSSPADSSASTVSPASIASTSKAVTALTGLPTFASQRGGSYHADRGIELYASTQRLPAAAPVAHIDVHA
jgi:hypothetical protein